MSSEFLFQEDLFVNLLSVAFATAAVTADENGGGMNYSRGEQLVRLQIGFWVGGSDDNVGGTTLSPFAPASDRVSVAVCLFSQLLSVAGYGA